MRGLSSRLPSFLRLDFFVRREGNKSVIYIGEITEAGASCLGWGEGWTATFDAIIQCAVGMPFPQVTPQLFCDKEYEQRYGAEFR